MIIITVQHDEAIGAIPLAGYKLSMPTEVVYAYFSALGA